MGRILHVVLLIGFFSISYHSFAQSLVISEVYGGGGNSGATLKNDFIELYNPTNSSIDVTGWSVQYNSATGSAAWQVTTLSGSIAPKGFYLIQQAVGTGGTINLPTPDATGILAMSGTNGKVALCNTNTALTGANPSGGALVDLVGYGTANGFEGAAATPALTNTTSVERKANAAATSTSMITGGADEFLGNGYDSQNNSADFITRTPEPQNSASPKEPATADATAPEFIVNYPGIANLLQSQFDLSVQLNEMGKAYYVVLADGATAPSAAQVKAGQDNASAAVSISGFLTITAANANATKTITGLTSNTTYDVFVVAEDAALNLQANPVKVDVTTSSSTTPLITPSLTSISFSGFTDKAKQSPSQSYTISASDLTNDVTVSVSGNFLVSSDNATFSTSITIAKALFSAVQTVYVKFNPNGNLGTQTGTTTHTSDGASNKTVSLSAAAIDPFVQNFNDPNFLTNSGWSQYSKVGAQVWASTNFGKTCLTGCTAATTDKAAQINGFASGSQNNEDWLISPVLDLTGFVNFPALSFWTISAFAGDKLQLKYSPDYLGTGDPTLATWTALDGKFPESNSSLWTKSSNIILPKQIIYVAIIYTSNTTAASRWTFDDWQLTDVSSYIDVPAISYSFGEVAAGSSSPSKNFTFTAIGYGNITIAAPAGYQVSLDDVSFSSSVIIPSAEAAAGKKIYGRFSPTAKQLSWDGTINFKGTGLDASYGTLKGSSYPKAETFDVATYNLEFFGTDVKDTGGSEFGPTDDALQIANVKTVLQTISADLVGVQEVSDDNAFNQLVTSLSGYSGVLANKWSYSFDPADPNFPPQKIGFIYNSSTVQLVSSRVMFSQFYDAVRAGTATLPGYPTTSSSFWSSGRLPFMATFDATVDGFKKRIRVVVIHAKSGSAQADYDRRKYDVKVLRDSLVANYSKDNIIVLGDFNDDVDTSINAGAESTYKVFVDDATNFSALTFALSQTGASTFPNSTSFLDHQIISDELKNVYIPNSISIDDPRSYISNYINTTSDHLPVCARFLLSVKADQSVTFATLPTKTFGDAAFPLTATSSTGLPVTFTSSNAAIATISRNAVTIVGAGTTSIIAKQVGNSDFNASAEVSQTLTVNKANQTITFGALADRTLGEAAFSLTASASSGQAVSFASSSDKVIINGNQVTLVKAGRAVITASQAGNTNYNAVTDVEQSFCIIPNKPTIALSNANTEAPMLTSSATAGNQWYLETNAIAGAINATYSALAAGIYKVQVKVDDCISEFSAEQLLIVTGDVSDNLNPKVEVYPNPTTRWLTVKLSEKIGKKAITVLGLTGNELINKVVFEKETTFDLTDFPQGIYLLKVIDGNSVQLVRFIKN